MEETFSASRSTYSVEPTQSAQSQPGSLKQMLLGNSPSGSSSERGTISEPSRRRSPSGEPPLPTHDKSTTIPAINNTTDELIEADTDDTDFTMGEPHLLVDILKTSGLEPPIKNYLVLEGPSLLPQTDDTVPTPSVSSADRCFQTMVATSDHDAVPLDQGHSLTDDSIVPKTLVPGPNNFIGGQKPMGVGPRLEATQSSFDNEIMTSSVENSMTSGLASSKATSASRASPIVPEINQYTRVTSTRRNANTNANTSATSAKRSIQMVLNTSGAAWNLSRDLDDDEDRQPLNKKSRVSLEADPDGMVTCKGGVGAEVAGKSARMNLRDRLSEFARSGSQVVNDDVEEEDTAMDEIDDEDNEGVQTEDEGLAVGRKPIQHEDDVDELDEDRPKASVVVDNIHGKDCVLPDANLAIKKEPPEIINLVDDSDYDTPGDILMLDADPSTVSSALHSQGTEEGDLRPEIIRSSDGQTISMRFDLATVTDTWRKLRTTLDMLADRANLDIDTSGGNPSLGTDAGVSNVADGGKAAEALSRVIDKDDFSQMDIAGQFNLGFIVTRRRKIVVDTGEEMDDLFIVDQHAADEKYNFEALQQSTVIKSQKLFRSVDLHHQLCKLLIVLRTDRPQPLELTAADELLATDNIEILRQNGFEVAADETSGTGLGHRLQLVAQPVSKSTTFDMKGHLRCRLLPLRQLTDLMRRRSRRAPPSDARSANGADGEMLEGAGYVCDEGLSEECHGGNAAEQESNDFGELPSLACVRVHPV